MATIPDFQSLAQPGIQGLRAYDPGHDIVALRNRFAAHGCASAAEDRLPEAAGGPLTELGSNENSYGPSPRAREALLDSLHMLHRYPDPLGADLKRALAARLSLAPTRIMLGNGSHELLMMLAQVFTGPDTEVIAAQFGFAVYALAAQAAGAKFIAVPALPADSQMPHGHDLSAMADAVSARTRMVYLANPNNPTGTWFSTAALSDFLARLRPDVLVVVDEAYLEYVTDPALVSAISLLGEHPNLVVTRTFSKAYGLAGLRLGYACAHPQLLAMLERARESFNVNLPALAACEAALGDIEHLAWVCRKNADEREWLSVELTARQLRVLPSQTNFLLADFGHPAAPVEATLVQRGVVLRPMAGYGLRNCLRITVGNRDENSRLLQALDEIGM